MDTLAIIGLALIAAAAAGYPIHRLLTERADLLRINTEYDATLEAVRKDNRRLRTMLASAESDVEWARIVLADVARERDMFEAAFTAEMLRQARAELLRPDEASGLATVHEIKAGRA